jgi:hypothetical protein
MGLSYIEKINALLVHKIKNVGLFVLLVVLSKILTFTAVTVGRLPVPSKNVP